MHIAHTPKHCSDFAEITHPFHPLKGKKYNILQRRNISGQEIFSLQGTSYGSFAFPRDWTDKAAPDSYQDLTIAPPILDLHKIYELSQLVTILEKNKNGVALC